MLFLFLMSVNREAMRWSQAAQVSVTSVLRRARMVSAAVDMSMSRMTEGLD